MHETERRALYYFIAFEKRAGRSPQEQTANSGVDIISLPRRIEVKGIRNNGFFYFSSHNYKPMKEYGRNYYCYVVVFGKIKTDLFILNIENLEALIDKVAQEIFEAIRKVNNPRHKFDFSMRLSDIRGRFKPV